MFIRYDTDLLVLIPYLQHDKVILIDPLTLLR